MNRTVSIEREDEFSWNISHNGEFRRNCVDHNEVATYCVGFAHGLEEAKLEVIEAVLEGLVDAYQTSELPQPIIDAVLSASKKIELKL